jgi:hypothetical protein
VTRSRQPVEQVIGVFACGDALVEAVRLLQQGGHQIVETWAPYDIDALDRVRRRPRSRLPRAGLVGGIVGGVSGATVLWWTNARSYPLNVGARPLVAIPAWIPITFESVVLLSATSLFIGLCLRLGLPRLWAPIDDVEGFERASVDEFWVAVAASDSADTAHVEAALTQLHARRVVRA